MTSPIVLIEAKAIVNSMGSDKLNQLFPFFINRLFVTMLPYPKTDRSPKREPWALKDTPAK